MFGNLKQNRHVLFTTMGKLSFSESIFLSMSDTGRFVPGQGMVLYPQIGDKMDIVCPRVEGWGGEGAEFYKLYMVQRAQLETCTITKADTPLLNCVKPEQDVKFTLKFQEFSPNLWGLEFFRGKDYYIISTSNGSLEGLENQEGGVCKTKSMKITMKVGQSPSYPVSSKDYPTRHPPRYREGLGKVSHKKLNDSMEKHGASQQEGETSGKGGRSTSVIGSEVALFVGAASGSVIFIIIIVTLVVVLLKYRQRHHKHPPQHTVTMSLRSLATPKRGNGGHSNGSELSDIIIPLRTADSIFCPHYEKVSGDYGHPVYIVQEIAPQSPTNIYYKV
uniref:Ephrin B2 n=1 Tax=Paramormyrops kingsleyae TaxID=1676925 RepID=A0A3B3S2C8_9TELE